MQPIATPEEMRRMDAETIAQYGVPGLMLMERAAAAVVSRTETFLSGDGRVLVLCGGGNNGGDGMAAARMLYENGYAVQVAVLADPGRLTGDAAVNLQRLPVSVHQGFDAPWGDECRPDVVIDALLGTGLGRDVEGAMAEAIGWMNGQRAPVVSVDIPSGIDGLTGAVRGCAVRAAATVTFGCPKRGNLLYPGREYGGELTVADIGIPDALLCGASCRVWDAADVAAGLPRRDPNTHKGHYGHAAVIAGSEGMMGAGALASASVLRMGAGLCTWIHPREAAAWPIWEVMTRPIAGSDGAFDESSAEAILRVLEGKTVLAMGPGLGRSQGTAAMVRRIVGETGMPLVLDADGITVMAKYKDVLAGRQRLCMTPHPGELMGLMGVSASEITADPVKYAQETARALDAVVLLKGAATVIAEPGGRLAVNATGNAGMATGGSGDVLTGIIAGLAAQGVDLFEAAVMGAWLHGRAGDLAADEMGPWSMLASDLLRMLPWAMSGLKGVNTHWSSGNPR